MSLRQCVGFLSFSVIQLFVECVELLQSPLEGRSPPHDHTHISLLLCCAAMERALGDVRGSLIIDLCESLPPYTGVPVCLKR